MARNDHTADDLDRLAASIDEASDRLRSIAKSMRESSMPKISIHSSTQVNFHIPEVIQWTEKAELEAKAQLRSFLAGVEPKFEIRKRYHANQKLAAAKKKPAKKKA